MASATNNAEIVTALFQDAAGVERAYQAALARKYTQDDINLVLSEETRRRYFTGGQVTPELAGKAAESTEKKSTDATELGGPMGGTAATIAPALAAVGTAALLPGLILAGPIAVALAAAATVGVAGGLIGALTNWGIPKTRIEEYEAQIRQGGILIGVKPRSEEDARHLQKEWTAAGGTLVHS
jgi:hypothetical protein